MPHTDDYNALVPLTDEQKKEALQLVLRVVYGTLLQKGQAANVSVPAMVSIEQAVEAAARAYLDGRHYRPAPITEQSCFIFKTGNTVTLECESGEEAEDMLDWLVGEDD